MQTETERTKIEHALTTAERVFFDSIKEEFEGVLPYAVITVYAKKPEFHERGARSGFMYRISDETLTEKELEFQILSREDSLTQRILDKAATYPDSKRYPDVNNRMRFLGIIANIGQAIPSSLSTELSEAEISDFYEIGRIGIKENRKAWEQFWDKSEKIIILLSLLNFMGVDVDIPEIINFIENIDISELTDQITELTDQIRDKIRESDIPEKIRDFFQKNEHRDREVGSNGT